MGDLNVKSTSDSQKNSNKKRNGSAMKANRNRSSGRKKEAQIRRTVTVNEAEVFLKPAFETNNIAIAMSSSNLYAPYVSVLIQSIMDNAAEGNNYDFLVLNKDISESNQKIISEHVNSEHFSVRFVDTNKYLEGRTLHTQGLAIETYFRFFLIDIMKNYSKVVYLDCDMVVNTDVANLYNMDIEGCYLAAARDANLITCYHKNTKWTPYLNDVVKMKNPDNYFQAGTLLVNLEEFRKDFTLEGCLDICSGYDWELFDQDVLNMICQDKCRILDMRWNVMSGEEFRLQHILKNSTEELKEEYLAAREDPFVFHYCGRKKPWDYAESDHAELFWKHAKLCPFYEVIIARMINNTSVKQLEDEVTSTKKSLDNIKKVFSFLPVKRKLVNTSTVNKSKASVEDTLIITASAKNTVGKCGYQFGIKTPGSKVFIPLQDFSEKNTVSYSFAKPGTYSFSARVKDEYGAEDTKIFHISVTAPVLPEVEFAPLLKQPNEKVALFRVVTVFQLLNAVNLKTTLLKHVKADLVLSKATDFSKFIGGLEEAGIFRKIYISDDTPETYFEWRRASKREQTFMMLYPEKYVLLPDLGSVYTDFYIAVADDYNKLYYYNMVKMGMRPEVHIFEDGLSTYLIDHLEECRNDIWNHNIYRDLAFIKHVSEILLYQPELHISNTHDCPINAIPKIDYKKNNISRMFNNIFGSNSLPKEKYIFLEEAFVWDGISSTDMDLVDFVARAVGKENIIVKMHPRNNINRFSKEGYKIVENSKIPWEMTVMNSDLSDKVFITVSSTSAFTAGLVFDKPFKTINLFDLMLLGKNVHVRNPKFHEFYDKLLKLYNKDERQVFHPTTMNELKEELIYLEGGVNNDE